MSRLVEFRTDDGPFSYPDSPIRIGEVAEFTNSSRIYTGYQYMHGLLPGEHIESSLNSLPSPKHRLLKPMPIEVDWLDSDEFVASARGTSIAISAETAAEAIRALKQLIVETYEILGAEPNLGRILQRDFRFLETYIGKKGGQQASAQ